MLADETRFVAHMAPAIVAKQEVTLISGYSCLTVIQAFGVCAKSSLLCAAPVVLLFIPESSP
jgi:hypothetical protein